MPLIKEIRVLRNSQVNHGCVAGCILLLLLVACGADAESCAAPARPYVPQDIQAASDYADIIRRDFDHYFRDIQSYLRCLDEERTRAFAEARDVSSEYRLFVSTADR